VADADDLAALVRAAASIHVAPALRQYLVELAAASRSHPDLGLGMSPRATLSLLRVSRVRALSAGRAFATPDDVKALVRPVLAHRLTTSGDARLRGISPEDVLGELVDTVPIPRAAR
jgi:MoxR-like ATPase